MLLRDVDADCTVVGVPGRVIHQSGVRINPLAHSQLPDAEAQVIRNLMERIDALENALALARGGQESDSEGSSQPKRKACGKSQLFRRRFWKFLKRKSQLFEGNISLQRLPNRQLITSWDRICGEK